MRDPKPKHNECPWCGGPARLQSFYSSDDPHGTVMYVIGCIDPLCEVNGPVSLTADGAVREWDRPFKSPHGLFGPAARRA